MSNMDPDRETFGVTPCGLQVVRKTISNGGTKASIITWGATLQDLRVDGAEHSLVLGGDRFNDYLQHFKYFGAIVGRVANRVENGQTHLNGQILFLDKNEDEKTSLHGGYYGSSEQNWTIDYATDCTCKLSLIMPDGQGGYPGNLKLSVIYHIDSEGSLNLVIEGQSDKDTYCNPAHHTYWNLSNEPDVRNHFISIDADYYLQINSDKIPKLAPSEVEGTQFDYRLKRELKRSGEAVLDHNFCLNNAGIFKRVCVLEAGSLRLELETDAIGLQVYDGDHLNVLSAKTHANKAYKRNAGLAIEPQFWPNAPNNPLYPSILLKSGDIFTQTSKWRLTKLDSAVRSQNV